MDIGVSHDFFPKIGGAHLWLYETYRRWPTPVTVVTEEFGCAAPDRAAVEAFDRLDHGAVSILRTKMELSDIDLTSSRSRRAFGAVSQVLRKLAVGGEARFHCLRSFPEGFCGLLAKVRRPRARRLIVYAHGEEILVARRSRQLSLMAKAVYRFADLVIANSRSTEELVRSFAPAANIVRIHPGVDAQAYVRSPAELAAFRERWGWPREMTVLSTVARMEPRKNQATVIRAVQALRQAGHQLAYVCCGDGPERASLMQLARDLGVEEWMRFPGAVSDAEKIMTYGACDFHVMPSVRHGEMIEGFGIVFLEAAAAGVPSICGNVGGQAEAVLHEKTGLVVDGSDPELVRGAIERMTTDVGLRKRLGQEAVSWAREHDWSRVSARTLAALQERIPGSALALRGA